MRRFPVEVDERECRQIAHALDISAAIKSAPALQDHEGATDLLVLAQRFTNAAAIDLIEQTYE